MLMQCTVFSFLFKINSFPSFCTRAPCLFLRTRRQVVVATIAFGMGIGERLAFRIAWVFDLPERRSDLDLDRIMYPHRRYRLMCTSEKLLQVAIPHFCLLINLLVLKITRTFG